MKHTYANAQQYYMIPPQNVRAGSDCGCGGPRMIVQMPGGSGGPGGPGIGTEPGSFPPGPGSGPGGPGGPGLGTGPGSFPPGPGSFPPGPGPGVFPPPRPPFPPYPVPFLFPFPPGPGPLASVTVVINGGRFFPNATRAYRVPFRPGLMIYQALAETGVVRFNVYGQISFVSGVPIGGNISYRLLLNGRIIPSTLLSFPVQRNDSVALELIYSQFPREEEHNGIESYT